MAIKCRALAPLIKGRVLVYIEVYVYFLSFLSQGPFLKASNKRAYPSLTLKLIDKPFKITLKLIDKQKD